MKENILNFDGFKFSEDSEEYEERKDFLERFVKMLFMKFLKPKTKINFQSF